MAQPLEPRASRGPYKRHVLELPCTAETRPGVPSGPVHSFFPPKPQTSPGLYFPLSSSVPHAYFSFCCPYPLLSLVLDGRTSVLVDGRLYACHACTHHPFSHHPCSPDSRGEICVFDGAFRTPVSSRFFVYQPVLFHLSPPPKHHASPILFPGSHGISPHSLPMDCRFPSVFCDTLTTFAGASGDILLCAVPSSRAGEGLTIEAIWPTLSSRPCPRTRLLLCGSLAVRVASDYLCEDPLCARELLDGVFFLQAPDHRTPSTQVETPEIPWHL